MRVLVCGGRDYADQDTFNTVMHELTGITCIIQGGASGADLMALNWAIDHNIPHEDYPAEWDDFTPPALVRTRRDGSRYNALAGHKRNTKMLVHGRPDLVIAFPGGRGTADMVRKSKDADIETLEIA